VGGDAAPGRDIVERDRCVVWHPYTSLQAPDDPLPVVAAQDEFLTLTGGRRVIDAVSSWWTILHGHRQPVLMRALAEASNRYDHVYFAGVTHEPAVELAESLLSTIVWSGAASPRRPGPDRPTSANGRVFYSDDGSTAVEVALKMAYQFWCHRGEPRRTCFVGFEHGYHGDTFGAMAVGRDPVFFDMYEPLLFRAVKSAVSPDALDATLTRLRGQVAAAIIEPLVQGAGGMRMHSPRTLRDIVDVARRHDVLVIADEVMTGGGRTGHLWAHQSAGVSPDLICAGKTLAGGVLPLAATLVAPHVVAAWDTSDRRRTFFHGHSFTAHPLACAVAVANWRMLAGGLGDAPAHMERFWTERLAELRTHPAVKELRVRGTIAAVELHDGGGYLADVGPRLRRVCLDRDVLLRPLGNVLYAMPPFCTSRDSLEQIAAAIEFAVESVT
jgi:adenosylmethionine-8-amino-7-oxononanoate aminotransferase